MDCPYLDCNGKGLKSDSEACRTCRRPIETCAHCRHPSRAFANFCTHCRKPLVSGGFDWTGFRGGPDRRGLNPSQVGSSWMESKLVAVENGITQLDDPCIGLLSWHRHLIAIGESGTVEARSPGAGVRYRLRTDGPPSCYPCVDRSTLFLGSGNTIASYSLGALTLSKPKTSPRWVVRIPGEATGALLVVGERLFVNTAQGEDVGVVVLDHVFNSRPPAVRQAYPPGRVSPMVGNSTSKLAHFLSEDRERVRIHTIDAGREAAQVESQIVPDLSSAQVGRTPIALMGKSLFAVLSRDEQLYRLQPGKPTMRLGEDVKKFSLNSFDERVQVETTGLRFPRGLEVGLTHMDRILGQPLVIRNFAFVAGLQDGRILIYDLNQPHFHREERPDGQAITALASFGPYLAAGTAGGTVALYEVVSS